MQHDETSGHLSTLNDIRDDRPVIPVPVADDLRSAIQAFHAEYPNLGAGSVLSEMRRTGFPDASWDAIRTVLAETV
jgi:hypothetical protein